MPTAKKWHIKQQKIVISSRDVDIIITAFDVTKIFLLFCMCVTLLWALNTVIKQQFFYIYFRIQ